MALGALSVLLSSLSLAVRRAPELWPAPQLPRLWAELDPALLALELLRWATPLDSTASLAAALSRPISLAALSVPAFVVANVALVALLDCQWRCRGASVGPPRPTVTLAAAFLGASGRGQSRWTLSYRHALSGRVRHSRLRRGGIVGRGLESS